MKALLPILLIFGALACLGGSNWLLGARAHAYFSDTLSTAGIAVPTASSTRELELLYAQTQAGQNPLVALPGTDLNSLTQKVNLLPALETRLQDINGSSTQKALLSSLYPDTFLKKLLVAEEARRKFVQSGKADDLVAYERAMSEMFTAYYRDAAAFKKAFNAAVPQTDKKFATDGDIVSRQSVLNGVDTLVKRMEETERRFKERIQCTHGATERCRDSITTPIVSTAPKNTPSPQELAVAQEVRYLQAKAHQDDSILEGPMYQLSASACTANIGAASLFVFYTPKGNSSYSGPIPLYVGTIRFQKLATISTSSESITTFGTALKNRLNYIYDSPMLHYSCTAFAKDTSTLFVLRDVYAFARTHVLSSYATSSEKGALKKLEETQQVVSEHDVSNYLRMAQQVPLPKNLHEQVTEYALAYQFRSAHFDASIGELLNDEFSNSLLMSSLWPVNLDVPYLFFVRSSFSMLLLADNASAGKEVSLFETNTLPSSKRPFIYYGNLPHTAQSVYQVIMDIRLFYEVHVDPKILETDVTAR